MVKCNEWQNVVWKKENLHTAIVHNRVHGGTWKGIRRRMWKEKLRKIKRSGRKGKDLKQNPDKHVYLHDRWC